MSSQGEPERWTFGDYLLDMRAHLLERLHRLDVEGDERPGLPEDGGPRRVRAVADGAGSTAERLAPSRFEVSAKWK